MSVINLLSLKQMDKMH